MAPKPRVLFVCIGNSARSQMAEAWLRLLAGQRFEALSAGTHPIPLHPLTIEVMSEVGANLAGARAKGLRTVLGPFDYVVTTCSEAEEECPALRGTRGTLHWQIPDPYVRAAAATDPREKLRIFREARERVRAKVKEFLTCSVAEGQGVGLGGNPEGGAAR